MKKKIILFGALLLFNSCGIFIQVQNSNEKVSKDLNITDNESKFIGNYDIEVFNLPDQRDGKFKMTIERDGNELKTTFNDPESAKEFDILDTEVEDGILYIDVYVKDIGVKVFFEIYVNGDKVTGYLADMFELEGTISN